jgi:outer membrane protein insertion porin family
MKQIAVIITLLTAAASLLAQTDSIEVRALTSFGTIDTIIIVGNEKTKDIVILREMSLKPGMNATPEAMEFDKGRIYSTGLFTRVEMSVFPIEGKNTLLVDLNERWYIIPLPLFGFRDNDPAKAYYGAGLLHNNFRGLNQKLFGSIIFGYNPSIALSFSDPMFDRANDLYFSSSASYSQVRNRSELARASSANNFDERHYDFFASLGKRFTLYENAGISLGYQIVKVTELGPGRTVSPRGIDKFLSGSLSYAYDSRNLRDYTTKGWLYSAYVSKIGFGESDVSFTRIGGDVRWFAPVNGALTIGSRIHGSIVSGGAIPTYARSYFGYGERIRGYFKDVFEGENIAGTSLELRWQLFAPRVVKFEAISLPQEFSIWRWGISLELFADAGTTWFRGEPVALNKFNAGYGAGIVVLLPYDYVVRTEYAWNDRGRGQFIFGIRAAF